jgi:hypothetical protein
MRIPAAAGRVLWMETNEEAGGRAKLKIDRATGQTTLEGKIFVLGNGIAGLIPMGPWGGLKTS